MQSKSDDLFGDKINLPKEVFEDGAKWLMVPSKVILDGLSVWVERQNYFTAILNAFCFLSYALFIYGTIYYQMGDVGLSGRAYALTFLSVMCETVVRRALASYYRNQIHAILKTIYRDFWPSTAAGDKLHDELNRNSRILFIYCAMYTFSAVMCGLQYNLTPMITRTLPFTTRFPFSLHEKSPWYEILFVWQGFLSLELPFGICGMDLLFASLLYNCVAQFKLLRVHFRENFEKIVLNGNEGEAERFVVECVKQHHLLIRVCEDINKVFSNFILIQYLFSVGTVCLSSFIVTVVPELIGTAVTYLMGHICELFIYCYMGNDLILESTELATTIYQSGWHLQKYNKNLEKSLIMIIMRSQKPINISAGGFGHLSLSSFVQILKFSFSVYTLLTTMMDKTANQS